MVAQPPAEHAEVDFLEQESELAHYLSSSQSAGEPIRTHLRASDRVIARVTDGIYREPASALRELISNAWDADANNVTILTDAPRFERIYVRDDGNGMSYQTLSYLIKNIGGSAKRNQRGQQLGVTGTEDADRSPKGRPLIGKVGIGLFSVSQLARRFRIVTKVQGEPYRLIAEVTLRAYSEDNDQFEDAEREADDKYISGVVEIVRQETADLEAHGTDLVLEELKPRVRDLLADRDRWTQVVAKEAAEAAGDKEAANAIRVQRPVYHSGWIQRRPDAGAAILDIKPELPWTADTPSDERMSLLMDAVERESSKTDRPDVASTLDAYLGMLWTLGLSAPVQYVNGHPFDLTASESLGLYWISNEQRGQASEVPMLMGETVRDAVRRCAPGNPDLVDGLPNSAGEFRVVIDSVELKRPIRFKFLPASDRSIKRSLLFVGKYRPDLAKVSPDRRGGGLEMEGYIFWNGKIIPKENNGVLIRIRGASGAVFDPTFFKYQVSELTRLRQLTSELFIQRGLDAALNIDRESFNFSHPHVQLVALWLQRGIRQLTNRHKEIAARDRQKRAQLNLSAAHDELSALVEGLWKLKQPDQLPEVVFGDENTVINARREGAVAFRDSTLLGTAKLAKTPLNDREAKARALVQVLLAFNVLQDRNFSEQEELINAILKVFYGSGGAQ